MTKHKGSCHCGAIAYAFEGEIGEAMECNCSLCARRGGLMAFVPASAFTLLTPPENIGTYHFNRHAIDHHFCPKCGIAPYSEGADANGNKMMAINLRCVEGVDPASLAIKHVDGRSF